MDIQEVFQLMKLVRVSCGNTVGRLRTAELADLQGQQFQYLRLDHQVAYSPGLPAFFHLPDQVLHEWRGVRGAGNAGKRLVIKQILLDAFAPTIVATDNVGKKC